MILILFYGNIFHKAVLIALLYSKYYTIIAQYFSLENLQISKIKTIYIYIKLYFQNSISRRLIYKWNDQHLTIFQFCLPIWTI